MARPGFQVLVPEMETGTRVTVLLLQRMGMPAGMDRMIRRIRNRLVRRNEA